MPEVTCLRCQTSFTYDPDAVRETPAGHKLLCGDSTKPEDVAKLLHGDKPFIMVTDPPYGVDYDPDWRVASGLQERGANGEVHNDTQCDWRDAWRLFPGDVAYVWHAGRYASTVQDSLEAVGLLIRAQIVWAKNQMVIGRGAYHWKHEPLWYAVRDGATARWVGGRDQTTVWEIDKNRASETGHSTQKPLECMARPIRNHGAEGDIVYDPFVGSVRRFSPPRT